MSDIENIGRQLADVLNQYSDYCIEARIEQTQTSQIIYRGRELESTGRATAIGGSVRAFVK
ncbi:TldD/PmbA family protein, partial [Chloroflexota bacterium]